MTVNQEFERNGPALEDEYTELVFRDDDNVDDMYLTFGVATEEYGIGIGYVTEIVSMQHIVQLPESAPSIKGVINLRGKVIPVMDLRLRFGLAPKDYSERTVIIVLSVNDVPVGLVVDHVSEVLEIPPAQIDTAVQTGGRGASMIRGFGKQANRFAAIVDVERMLDGQLTSRQIH